jgi:hypothetical protein
MEGRRPGYSVPRKGERVGGTRAGARQRVNGGGGPADGIGIAEADVVGRRTNMGAGRG